MERKGTRTERGNMLRSVQAANAMYDYAQSAEPEEIQQLMQDIEELEEELSQEIDRG